MLLLVPVCLYVRLLLQDKLHGDVRDRPKVLPPQSRSIALLGQKDQPNDELTDYAGLWHSHPALAALMTIALLSLGGIPPTVGFIGKWYIFSAAVSAGYYGLAIIGVLTSVVSVFFYLRVVVMMYMSERDARPVPAHVTTSVSSLRRAR